jgi:hypothetical protein
LALASLLVIFTSGSPPGDQQQTPGEEAKIWTGHSWLVPRRFSAGVLRGDEITGALSRCSTSQFSFFELLNAFDPIGAIQDGMERFRMEWYRMVI